MMTSCPDAVPEPLGLMDIESLGNSVPLDELPSPSRPGTCRANPPEPQTPDLQVTKVSSLLVGSSSCTEGSHPVTMRQGDLKASGTVTAQGFHAMSDMRLKHNILPLDIDAVAILDQLNIVQFKWDSDPQGRPQIGVIAQQVAQVLADAVKMDTATGLNSVNVHLLLFVTMRALKDFLPLLTELDKQHRLGLPLLMLRQQQVAQQAPTPDQKRFPARALTFTDSIDSDSASDFDTSDIDTPDPGLECSSNSPKDQQPSFRSAPPIDFKNDAAMIAQILADLGEDNPGMPFAVRKLLGKLGKEVVWGTYLQAQVTSLPAADGSMRSPGSTFLHLLKKQEQEAKIT